MRRKESAANSFAADRKRISSLLSFCLKFVVFHRFVLFLFCRFILSFFISLFSAFLLSFCLPTFCRFFLFFVVFSLRLIRERRGALLLALNEESAAKVIAANSSRRIVLLIKILFNFYLPAQARAPSFLTTKRE